jgi:N6-L-threonylcarbamoyladenine synthase
MDARRQSIERGDRSAAQLLPLCSSHTLELLSSFQRTVVAELVGRTLDAAQQTRARSVLISGGVAANSALRSTFIRQAADRGLPIFFPSRQLSTDNAAMIAAAAYPKFLAKDFAAMDFSAEASLLLR